MGPGVGMAHIPQVLPRALKGKPVRVFGSADQPHSWTDVRDMGRALVALVADESIWGRVWHAPTNEPRTQAEAVADCCRSVGRDPVKVRAYPRALLSVGGVVVPILREMRETVYQFERPYVLDSSAIEAELGLKPTPWDEVCRATAESAAAG
jgi:nucleoside-diphosphate-sugar epimerase